MRPGSVFSWVGSQAVKTSGGNPPIEGSNPFLSAESNSFEKGTATLAGWSCYIIPAEAVTWLQCFLSGIPGSSLIYLFPRLGYGLGASCLVLLLCGAEACAYISFRCLMSARWSAEWSWWCARQVHTLEAKVRFLLLLLKRKS